jgi:hypothetical protein
MTVLVRRMDAWLDTASITGAGGGDTVAAMMNELVERYGVRSFLAVRLRRETVYRNPNSGRSPLYRARLG